MEVQDRVDVQIRKLRVSTFPGIAQRASNKEVCPILVSDTKRSRCRGLVFPLAERLKRRDSYALTSLNRDRYARFSARILHIPSHFVRESDRYHPGRCHPTSR